MKLITTLAAAALVAGSASLALAQAGGGASGGAGGAGASGAGGAPAAPYVDSTTRAKSPAGPTLRRGDDMAPMQGSNVSGTTVVKKKKHRALH
jgi:hypothetical protein